MMPAFANRISMRPFCSFTICEIRDVTLNTGDIVVVVFADLLDCRIEFPLAAAGDENVGTF